MVGAVLVAVVVFSCISARVGCASLIRCGGALGSCGLGVSVWLLRS